MSYILEALKRASAERERESGAPPDLRAQALPVAAPLPGSSSRLWPWIALGLGTTLLAGGLWWWQGSKPVVAVAGPAVVPAPAAAPAPIAAPSPPAPVQVEKPVATPMAPAVTAPVAVPAPAPKPPPVPDRSPDRILSLAELPDDLRAALPKFNVNGSVYSAQPAERLLILSGQPLREGENIAPDLVLEQIRPQSAVLRLRGTRFLLNF